MEEKKAHTYFWAKALGVYAVWGLAAAAGVAAGWILDRLGMDPGLFSGLVMHAGYFLAACFQMLLFWVYLHPMLTRKRWAWMVCILAFFHIILGFIRLGGADMGAGGLLSGAAAVAGTANLLMFSYLLGSWLITPVKQAKDLVKVCAVAAAADALSFILGPTLLAADALAKYYGEGMKGPAPLVDVFLVKLPDFSGNFMPVMGVADWIVIAVLSFAALNLGLNDNLLGPPFFGVSQKRRPGLYLPAAAFGGLICVVAARALGAFLPALPMIGAVFLARIRMSSRQIPAMGRTDTLLFAGVLVLAIVMAIAGLAAGFV